MSTRSKTPRLRRFLLLCFFLSGATALVYEVLWTRRLTLTFGHSVLAVSTVVTTFMLGLGAGSLLGGRWADAHPERCLRAYGLLEICIGCWALLSLPLLGLVEAGYVSLAAQGVQGVWLPLAGCLGALVALLLPTMAMGATLPILSRRLSRSYEGVASLVSELYGWNTLGALVGAAAAGFLLLPAAGMRLCVLGAALLNIAIGGVVIARAKPEAAASGESSEEWPGDSRPGRLLLAFGLAGFASMVYQVGWTRSLLLSLGSSTYAFTAVLVTFLAGIGLGSLALARVDGRLRQRLAEDHLAWLQVAVAASATVAIILLGYLPLLFFFVYPYAAGGFGTVLLLQIGLCVLVLLVPCLLMGLSFPIANHLYARRPDRLGAGIGEVYAANTAGCILGAAAAGFALLPQLGCQSTLKVGILASLVAGLVLFRATRAGRALALLLVVVALALPGWDPGVMAGGIAVYAESNRGRTLEAIREEQLQPPAFYRDGLSSTVSIHFGGPDALAFRVNGKTDGSLGPGDRRTMFLTGYLGDFLHPNPRSAAVIGYGTGMTVEALSHFPSIERIDCAELEPAVMEAARYWQGHNGGVLTDPRVTVHIADGRTFIKASPRDYDLIVSEPSNVWMAGVGDLYTVDFFRTCRDRLTAEGLMVQWFHYYGVSRTEVATVCGSFFEAFPEGSLWMSNTGDVLLVGSKRPVLMDLQRVQNLYASSFPMRHRLYELGILGPDWLSGHFLMARKDVLELFPDRDLNTDDRPVLEFRAPRHYNRGSTGTENHEFLLKARKGRLPPGVASDRRFAAANAWLNLSDRSSVQALLGEDTTGPEALLLKARFLQEVDPNRAQQVFRSAMEASSGDLRARIAMAWVDFEGSQGRFKNARDLCLYVVNNHPEWDLLAVTLVSLGQSCLSLERPDQAEAALTRALEYPVPGSYVLTMLGLARAQSGRLGPAKSAFSKALRINPYDLAALNGMTKLEFGAGRFESALHWSKQILALLPASSEMLVLKGVCQARLGRPESAAESFRAALYYDPDNETARENLEAVSD